MQQTIWSQHRGNANVGSSGGHKAKQRRKGWRFDFRLKHPNSFRTWPKQQGARWCNMAGGRLSSRLKMRAFVGCLGAPWRGLFHGENK